MFKHQDLQMCCLKLTDMNKYYPLEVVGRGGEMQLQVGKDLNNDSTVEINKIVD